jgi:uncharacterized protein (DUF1501 family)
MSEMKNDNGINDCSGVLSQLSFSHFRATDIWFTASNSNQTLDSGWLDDR